MKPQKQLFRHRPDEGFRHRPDEGLWGDCYRTAVACLLEIEPTEVPHVYFGGPDGPGMPAMRIWLVGRGLGLVTMLSASELADVLTTMEYSNPGVFYLLTGLSRTGVDHVVICCGGQIVWDPSLDDAGIVGPSKHDGMYWLEFITPSTMLEAAA